MSKLMKGFVAGLMVVGLLAVGAPAKAQGLGDPLTLAASGVLIPYFGATNGDVSLLEISSPVGNNPLLHFIFYNANCTRTESFPTADTTNDTDLYNAAAFSGNNFIVTGVDGLIAIAADGGDGINMKPIPIDSPLHTRLYHFNVNTHRYRVLEPIILNMAESPSTTNTWHPLRSGATFFAPQEGNANGLKTTLYLICPKDTIQGAPGETTSAFPVNKGFPNVNTVGFASAYAVGSLRGRVYDTDEVFLRDWQTDCNCLTTKVLSGAGALSPVYLTSDTYTEIETDGSNNKFFTGYKGLTFGALAEVDFFGRLSNANRLSLQDNPPGSLQNNKR
jgi:hypothetical protein